MVNHDYEFIFAHTPKCGGISIEHSLPNGELCNSHILIKDYKKIFNHKLDHYFKFSCARSPWDRLVSLYFFWKQQDESSPHWKWDKSACLFIREQNLSFKKFLQACFVDRLDVFWKRQHIMPSCSFARGADYVIQFDSMQDDFNYVCDKLNLPRKILPKLNSSKHSHYSQYYDEYSKNLIGHVYNKDIELFNYCF